VHVLILQRDLFVGGIIHIEIKYLFLVEYKKFGYIYIYIIPSLCAGHVARMGEKGVYRVLVWKPEGKRPLRRPRRRRVDNIRTDLQEVGCGYMDWIGLAQDRDRWRTLLSAVKDLRFP